MNTDSGDPTVGVVLPMVVLPSRPVGRMERTIKLVILNMVFKAGWMKVMIAYRAGRFW